MTIENKKILIISNNPLSNIQHNGKTLASIIKGIRDDNIYQIYLNNAIPDFSDKCHYYNISEIEIIRAILNKEKCGIEVKPQKNVSTYNYNAGSKIKKSNLVRLLRELIWKSNIWKNQKFKKWIENSNVDCILFMAGDSIFAYDICKYVKSIIDVPLTTFITDDYIMPIKSINFISKLRRKLVYKKMKKCIKNSNLLLTISNEMAREYKKIFNKDSLVVRNYSDALNDGENIKNAINENEIKIIYAGGVHFNRWKILSKVGEALNCYNNSKHKNVNLYVYSSQQLSRKILNSFKKYNIKFCGGVNKDELYRIYQDANILLHVESFDRKSINATRLSFSTKIPEYMSMKKCILAIGPDEVASIKYLKDCAYCINNINQIEDKLEKILNQDDFRNKIALDCRKKFEKDFNEEDRKKILLKMLS